MACHIYVRRGDQVMASSTTMHAWSEVNYATSGNATSGSCATELSNILKIDGEYSSICDYTNVVENHLGKSA